MVQFRTRVELEQRWARPRLGWRFQCGHNFVLGCHREGGTCCSVEVSFNNAELSKVIAFTLAGSARGFDEQTIGAVQSLFSVSASVRMSFLTLLFPCGWERWFMACPFRCWECHC